MDPRDAAMLRLLLDFLIFLGLFYLFISIGNNLIGG